MNVLITLITDSLKSFLSVFLWTHTCTNLRQTWRAWWPAGAALTDRRWINLWQEVDLHWGRNRRRCTVSSGRAETPNPPWPLGLGKYKNIQSSEDSDNLIQPYLSLDNFMQLYRTSYSFRQAAPHYGSRFLLANISLENVYFVLFIGMYRYLTLC